MTKKRFTDLPDQESRNIKQLVGESEQIDEEEWGYSVPKKRSIPVEGKEIYMAADKGGDTIYGGKFVRDLMESRKHRPKSYTWLGYIRDPKKGLTEVGIPHNALFKHTAVFGNSGYGKSTVMKNMMLQWAHGGFGFCFIDPKGDDSPDMMKTLPEHRLDDVVWVEPGATSGRQTVGFNILETGAEPGTQEQETEANAIVDDLLSLFEAESMHWNPQLEGVISAILEKMIKSKKEYTIADLYKVLKSESERKVFMDMYDDELTNMEKDYIDNVAQHELETLIETLKNMLSKPIVKETLSESDTKLSITEAIEEDKIILANFSNISEEDLKFVTAAFVRRIWSTIKSRKDVPKHEREPYFLCIDEFDNTTKDFPDEDDLIQIAEILSTARSYRLSVMVANQNPTQLADDIKEDVFGNCNNLFTFNQGNMQDASDLAQPLEDVNMRNITTLDEYRLLGRLTIDGKKTPGLIIDTFPEYPKLRTETEYKQLLDEVCEKYGIGESEEFDEDNYGVIRYSEDTDDNIRETIGNTIVDTSGVLSLIRSAELNPNTEDKVNDAEIKEIMSPHIYEEEFYNNVKSNIISKHVDSEIEEINTEEGPKYRLTKEGINKLKEFLNNDKVEEAHKKLSSLGLYSSIPFSMNTGQFYSYDLICYPPIQPIREAETIEQAKKLEELLESSYEHIYEKFGDKRILVKHINDPAYNLEKIAKSVTSARNKSICVLLANSKEEAEAIKTILQKDEFIKKNEKGERVLYETQNPLDLEQNKRPVSKKKTRWLSKEGNYILKDEDNNMLKRFEEYDDIANIEDAEIFSYHLNQGDENIELIEVESGNTIKEYTNIDEVKQDDNYNIINKPFIKNEYIAGNLGYEDNVRIGYLDDEFKLL